jgi:methyl-accepting chemotaxis protein
VKIGLKLVMSFAAVSAVGALIGGAGIWGLQKSTHAANILGDEGLPAVESLMAMSAAANEIKAAERTLLDPSLTSEERKAQFSHIKHGIEVASEARAVFDSIHHEPSLDALWVEFTPLWDEWQKQGKVLTDLASRFDEMAAGYNSTPYAAKHNFPEAVHLTLDNAHAVLATFKTQVQEWKNVLLRGKDRAQYDKYLAAFKREEASVQDLLAGLAEHMSALGLKASLAHAAREAHVAAGARYAEALGSFDHESPNPAPTVDALVKGVDRSVADAIEAVIAEIGALRDRVDETAAELRHESLVASADTERAIDHLLAELVEGAKHLAHEEVEQAHTAAAIAQTVVIVAIVSGSILSIGLGLTIAANVRTRLNAMTLRLKDIAEGEGDLTQRVDSSAKDEIGELGTWFNTFVEKIQGIMVEITSSASGVASASTEIAASNEEMSAGLAEQADQVSQVSAATEEMSATSQEVANKSTEGKGVVEETVRRIEEIAGEVKASAAAVNTLGQKSEEIGQIIAVINDIADQTNLLALNAAIEAARAGEHGRGFAVVADEVRKLAERTTQATEQVGSSIREIQSETEGAVRRMEAGTQKVQGGVEFARQAGDALGSIVAAAEQQSAATIEISQSVEQINSVAMQSKEGAQQAAAAAAQLSAEAEKLQALVGRFKV